MAASANSIKKIMDLDVDRATGRIVMNIRITVDGTPARNAFVGGKADQPARLPPRRLTARSTTDQHHQPGSSHARGRRKRCKPAARVR